MPTSKLDTDSLEHVAHVPSESRLSRRRNDFVRGLLFPERKKSSTFDGHNELIPTVFGNLHTIKLPARTPERAKNEIYFIHGNLRSASHCAGDILSMLAIYGDVNGVNLSGYEQSTPPFEGKKMAEVSHTAGARAIACRIKVDLAASGRSKDNVAIVTRSVGTYMSAHIAKELGGAHMVCIVPLASLETTGDR